MNNDGWQSLPFGKITKNFDSQRIPVRGSDRRTGKYPYYGASGIIDYVDDYLFDGEFLLVAEDGENLQSRKTPVAFMAKGKFWVNNHAHIVQGNDLVLTRFLYYFLQEAEIDGFITGSAQPKLTQDNLNRILVDVPPIREQENILRILGALDDKIELNRRMNHTLEEMARGLFKSWFVDFDPVTAKAEGRVPFGMNAETAALFPAEFEETEHEDFPQIPTDWALANLDDIANYENGLALQKFPPEGNDFLPVIKIRELRQGFADESSDRASTTIKESCILSDGDVVFSWSGSLMIDLWCGGKGALNQHLFKVTSDKYPKWFYYFWTEYHLPDFQDIAEGKATTMGHIQRHHLTSAKVVVPSGIVLERADKTIAPLLDSIVKNRVQNKNLASIRDALLPRLLSGELRVKVDGME